MALVAIPATVEELRAQRVSMRVRSLNDDVEEIHLKLWSEPDYQKWFQIIWSTDSVEGSHALDDGVVAGVIRTYAKNNNIPIAATAKLQSIVRSLAVVRRKYRIGRTQLRKMVGNQTVDGDDEDSE